MALTTFTDGNVLYDHELNNNFGALKVVQVYTGTGFNSTYSNTSSGNQESSYELSAISSATLGNADYVIIEVTYSTTVNAAGTTPIYCDTQMKIQTKEIGGAYADSLAYQTIFHSHEGEGISIGGTYKYYHTLSAGEKSAGVQVKVFSNSAIVTSGTSVSASFTNVQTVLSLTTA